MSQLLLEMKKLDKKFGNVYALKKVDFELKKGEVHAILGANGAGKSTLVKMISGAYVPDQGEILLEGEPVLIKAPQVAKDLGISIVYQEFSLFNHLNITENIFAGRMPMKSSIIPTIDYSKMYADSEEVLSSVGIHINPKTLVGDLPVGEQQIVEICKAISLNAKVLILDEPTSALNANEIEKMFNIVRKLKANGVGIIYITHRLNELSEICDRVTVMRDGQNIGTFNIDEKTTSEMVDLMLGDSIKGKQKKERKKLSDEPVLALENLTTDHITDVTFSIRPGEIIGLAGQMGSGRTEIFKAIFGYETLKSGKIYVNGKPFTNPKQKQMINEGIGFVTEDRKTEGILQGRNIKENIVISIMSQISKSGILSSKMEDEISQKAIAQTGLYPNLPNKEIEFFSGGNQQKALLGRWLVLDNLKLLLLDEPTRGIDVGAKGQIYSLLDEIANKGISIIIASSDLDEIVQVVDRVLIVEKGRIANEIQNDDLTVNDLTKAIMEGAKWSNR